MLLSDPITFSGTRHINIYIKMTMLVRFVLPCDFKECMDLSLDTLSTGYYIPRLGLY